MLIYDKKRRVKTRIIKVLLILDFFLYKFVNYIVESARYVNFRKSNNNFFLRNRNNKIIKRRQILNNIRDIVDYKFNFLLLAQVLSCTQF